MQSKVLIVTLVIVGSMFGYASAQCELKQPQANNNTDSLQGKFYLVAMEKAFSYQDKEEHCTSTEVNNSSLENFPYFVTYQDTDGSPQQIILYFETLSPPGTYNVTGDDGDNFVLVVLDSIQDSVHVLYACNTQNNKVAVWIYYSSRVQGFQQMEFETQRFVIETLENNNIPRNDLHDIDNRKCNNN